MRRLGITYLMYDYPVHKSPIIFLSFGYRTAVFIYARISFLNKLKQVVIYDAEWDTWVLELAHWEGV